MVHEALPTDRDKHPEFQATLDPELACFHQKTLLLSYLGRCPKQSHCQLHLQKPSEEHMVNLSHGESCYGPILPKTAHMRCWYHTSLVPVNEKVVSLNSWPSYDKIYKSHMTFFNKIIKLITFFPCSLLKLKPVKNTVLLLKINIEKNSRNKVPSMQA